MYVCISYNTGKSALPDIYARCPRARSAQGKVHIHSIIYSCLVALAYPLNYSNRAYTKMPGNYVYKSFVSLPPPMYPPPTLAIYCSIVREIQYYTYYEYVRYVRTYKFYSVVFNIRNGSLTIYGKIFGGLIMNAYGWLTIRHKTFMVE